MTFRLYICTTTPLYVIYDILIHVLLLIDFAPTPKREVAVLSSKMTVLFLAGHYGLLAFSAYFDPLRYKLS